MSDLINAYFTPSVWPLLLRRTFLLTLPVSAPIWLVGFLVGVAVGCVFMLIALIVVTVDTLWRAQP